uniref:Ig-like domain-containing protein n=1 Tax=Catharus ustulatus TaxID=91951 RepID=A0A8C3Y3B0_CATUS
MWQKEPRGWCPLSPAGAQTPQLLVEPPWTPAVLWDRVTLTCQGSGTAGDTTWYRNKRRVGQERRDSLTVTESGNYTCRRPGSGLRSSLMVSMVSGVWVSPAWHPRRPRGLRVGSKLGTLQDGTELSLSPLQLNHSGRYHCRGWLVFWESPVCVPAVPVANATITPGPPALPVTPLLEVTPQGTTGHLWLTGGVTQGSHVGLRPPDHR